MDGPDPYPTLSCRSANFDRFHYWNTAERCWRLFAVGGDLERIEEVQQTDSYRRDHLGEVDEGRRSSSASSQSTSSFQTAGDRGTHCGTDVTPEPPQEPPPPPPPPPVAREPPPLVPLIGRRLTDTAETMMLGMQARIASRATERSRALRARQRRQERRQEQKAAKTLSAILLAFVITWTPYNVFAIVQTFCADCIHQHLYEFGQLWTLCQYQNTSPLLFIH